MFFEYFIIILLAVLSLFVGIRIGDYLRNIRKDTTRKKK